MDMSLKRGVIEGSNKNMRLLLVDFNWLLRMDKEKVKYELYFDFT